jgi:[protein-PII] uridylyltransferase
VTAAARAARTEEADRLCRSAFSSASGSASGDGPGAGVALVAVGGYGRGELAPCSDLDVVLVHDASVDVEQLASRLWYPLWDSGARLDHSVRSLDEVTRAAAADVRVALGLLDARHLAGDTTVSLKLRAEVGARWRRDARDNLPRLRDLVRERAARVGELAHASVPDLKESTGGLRDATVLKALVATWLVDVPHADLERSRRQLLDLRDVLHEAAGRGTDRVVPELWADLAEQLGLPDEQEAQRRLRQIGRRIAHLSQLTWARVDRVIAPPSGTGRRRQPRLEPVAPGIAVSAGEVVLARGADPDTDPPLLLRAAAVAAERGLMLSPPTVARLARSATVLPEPWPADARDAFVRLLAAGPGLLPVWETLDETGALDRLLPEWRRIRLLPHASMVHRFTVDRHVVESCVEAARLIRRVARPDLLLVAALLHDIGKGGLQDHSVAGEPLAAAAATRMGFDAADVATIAALVRHHLLLADTATSRDLEDPATVEQVVGRVGSVERLELLEVLTEADARAASPQAWSAWRATLVADLVRRVRTAMVGAREAGLPLVEPSFDRHPGSGALHVEVTGVADGSRIQVSAADRIGLMADVAGALGVLRLSVRSARAWTSGGVAVSCWEVPDPHVDAALVSQRITAVAQGSTDPAERLRPGTGSLPPSVLVHHGASRDATVLEVRTDDQRGVVFLACRAVADLDLSVRSAHVTTRGPQALDVFYLQEPGAGALTDDRAADAAHAVRRALERAVTLDH